MSELGGDKVRTNANINEAVQAAMTALKKESDQIGRGVKAPQADLESSHKKLVDEVGANRGRPLFFPFVGTGIGNGPYVELTDGSVKLDLINGIGIHIRPMRQVAYKVKVSTHQQYFLAGY